jgi:plastocyanin
MSTKKLLLAATVTAAVVGLTGCGSSGDTSNAASTPKPSAPKTPATSSPNSTTHARPAAAMITIKDFAFQGPSSVKPGAELMVMNSDAETHSVTSDTSGLFDVTVEAGATAKLTAPTKPGSYPYHCAYHATMHGTLVVT